MASRRITLLLSTLVLLAACDSEPAPEEELPLARIEVRLAPSAGTLITVSVAGTPDLATGTIAPPDTIVVQPDETYEAVAEFFDTAGANVTSRIRDNAEAWQLLYSVLDADGVHLQVTDSESAYGGDTFGADLPVGIRFELIVDETAPRGYGNIRLRVGQFGPGQKTGSTIVGSPLLDTTLPLFVDTPIPPIPNENITRARLRLDKDDGSESWVVDVVNTFSLNLGEFFIPDNLEIVRCVPDTGAPSGETCGLGGLFDPLFITLRAGRYTGSWWLSDTLAATPLAPVIRESGTRHLFNYRSNLPGAITITDTDAEGAPLGLEFTFDIPTNTIVRGGLTSTLFHFDPTKGETKAGGVSTSARDLQYRIQLLVQQNGFPEDVKRLVYTLERTDSDSLSRVTAVGGRFGVYDSDLESLEFEKCGGVGASQVCEPTQQLDLRAGATYRGSIALEDSLGGDSSMREIMDEATLHLFAYLGFLGDSISTTDTDPNGEPVGFATEIAVPSPSADSTGDLQIRLLHYGRFAFKDVNRLDGETDLNFTFPVRIVAN